MFLLLHSTAILGFENEYGFRQYSKKQYIAPEKKYIKLSGFEAEVFCNSEIGYLLHPGNFEYSPPRPAATASSREDHL